MPKLELLLDTHARNFRLTQWPRTVLDPFQDALAIVTSFLKLKATIDADRHLTPEGKDAARVRAGKAALDALTKWSTPRLAGLDADLGVHRAALLPASAEKPDARRADFLLSHLRDKTPQEIATFYNSATPDEQQLMEAVAASVGRIPRKMPNGSLEWAPLLAPETVNESIMARARARNPEGVKKLEELTEIRAMHVTVAGVAASEVREALSGYNLGA